ncbi:MAG: acyloxyacyl hydrolase [Alphaproteobacteria bacterium]|nr:acyloxyacyl hydrolase [Alphaproteobacteria bacterium]
MIGTARRLAVASGVLVLGMAAHAEESDSPWTGFAVSDLRAGVFAHDVYGNWIPNPLELDFSQIEDIHAEVLLLLPELDAVRWMGSPKLNLGGTVNLDGQESHAHLALTWQVPVFDTPGFVEASIGGAVHNGILTGPPPTAPGMARPLGSRFLFYTSLGIGVNFNENAYGLLSYEHISNAELASPNFGVSNLGIKLGIRLD